jgi:hypothetical protein
MQKFTQMAITGWTKIKDAKIQRAADALKVNKVEQIFRAFITLSTVISHRH